MIQVLHNSRCGKSREAIQYLDEKGVEYEIIEYLKKPLSFDDLTEILSQLKLHPSEVIRTNEAFYKSDIKGKELETEELIYYMIEEPKLIQRPIVIQGDNAIIARPVEVLDEFLK